tara:strand:- start:12863 stop:13060 length:198 start_codon:yes stop_codon:yes gene_type:complete
VISDGAGTGVVGGDHKANITFETIQQYLEMASARVDVLLDIEAVHYLGVTCGAGHELHQPTGTLI